MEAWCEGRESNLRALISSMDQVLWEGAKWKPLDMGDVSVWTPPCIQYAICNVFMP
jgi:hypothetical protein